VITLLNNPVSQTH